MTEYEQHIFEHIANQIVTQIDAKVTDAHNELTIRRIQMLPGPPHGTKTAAVAAFAYKRPERLGDCHSIWLLWLLVHHNKPA